MSGPNLNVSDASSGAPERFDLQKHVHSQKPFFSGVKMLVAVLVSLAGLSSALLGGTYLLIAGPPADFYQKPPPPFEPGKKAERTKAEEKSFQDEVSDLFESYRSGWNGGSFPTALTTSDFHSTDSVGKDSTNANNFYSSSTTIDQIKVANLAQVSNTEASATVDELGGYPTGIQNWFLNAGGSSQSGDLVIKRVTEYEYRLINSGGWKIKSRKWLRQSGALIQQANEATLTLPFDVDKVNFEDKRPSKESLDKSYQAIASDLQSGVLGVINFPTNYTITFTSGGTIDRSEIAGRLDKFKRNASFLEVTYVIESVDQTGSQSAEATVRYSARFVPVDSPGQNTYVAVWRDRDTWIRSSDTSDVWFLKQTDRLLRSPILQHYEDKIPPAVAPGAPPITQPNSTQSPPSTGAPGSPANSPGSGE